VPHAGPRIRPTFRRREWDRAAAPLEALSPRRGGGDTLGLDNGLVTHVANVAWPSAGECFRMVNSGFNGHPHAVRGDARLAGDLRRPEGGAVAGLNGSLTTNTAQLTGCTGNTGGSGTFPPSAFAQGHGTITWANSQTTSISITFKALKKAKGCPSAAYSEHKAKGATTADTTGSATAGSKVKGDACVDVATGSLISPAGGQFQV
jgi:hypothetical protein